MREYVPVNYEKVRTVEKAGSLIIYVDAVKDLDRALNLLCEANPPAGKEDEDRILDLCPYFAIVWPAARGLAWFLAERRGLVKGKKCIEVGCGLGLPSLVAAKLGADVLSTDFHPDVGPWVLESAAANLVKVDYRRLDWTDVSASQSLGKFDFVLASDVLYEKRHPEDLVRALVSLVKPDGKILLSDPGRGYLQLALDALEKFGFHWAVHSYSVEESSHRPEDRLEQRRTVFVYEATRDQVTF